MLGRQVISPRAQHDRKFRALAFIAGDANRAPVQCHEFVHERKTYAGPLVRARPRAFDPVKPMEQLGLLTPGDTDAGVLHDQQRAALSRRESHADSTLERKLERIREKIHHDFFPHVAVDVDRRRQRPAIDRERKPRLVERGVEGARQIRGVACKVGRNESC